MEKDIVIRAEGLGKKYIIGHQAENEHYTALRDVMARTVKGLARSAREMIHGQAIVPGDTLEDFWALKGINFEIRRGDVVGIIGRNGAGKSTLLKILSRITEPTEGRVEIRGRVASLLEVGTGFHPELTGRENIYLNGAILGMTRAEIRRKFDEIVEFAEVEKFLDTPVKRYSSGMYVRLAFAVAAHLEPEVLVVDEVLAVGDAEFQKKCLGKMGEVAGHGRTVLFVSHNMGAVERICQEGIFLENGRIKVRERISNCIEEYLNSGLGSTVGHIIRFPSDADGRAYVTRIELLDGAGNPLRRPCTWGFVRFRIYFTSTENISNGSVVLYLSTNQGSLLSMCSTRPDNIQQVAFHTGENYVDCDFERLALSAGVFVIGAGLAVPNVEWIFNEPLAATFEVEARDVFGSGLAPAASRYPVPMSHKWRLPTEKEKMENTIYDII
jgi:homopolymeric O-antigen transport system ATP-binding protein